MVQLVNSYKIWYNPKIDALLDDERKWTYNQEQITKIVRFFEKVII